MRRENSQGAVQRAQAAAAQARALAMWHPDSITHNAPVPGSSSSHRHPLGLNSWLCFSRPRSSPVLGFALVVFLSYFMSHTFGILWSRKQPIRVRCVFVCVCVYNFLSPHLIRSHWFRISRAKQKILCSVDTLVLNLLQAQRTWQNTTLDSKVRISRPPVKLGWMWLKRLDGIWVFVF